MFFNLSKFKIGRLSFPDNIFTLSIAQLIVIGISLVLVFRLINEAMLVFAQIFYKPTQKNEQGPQVSIIVCARNEAENLKKHIPLLCNQKYKSFEVLVVNDASVDDTDKILRELKKKYKNLRSTHISKDPKFDHGKKLALTIGIKASKYDHLLLIDADCRPETEKWLAGMAGKMLKKEIVLGYGGYTPDKSLINRLIRFDTLQIAKNYMGLARFGLPYMGVGRNLAYHKSIYEKARGFSKHYHIASGDDDLLVNQMASRKNTTINLDPDTFTRSIAEPSFRGWRLQKMRHLGAGSLYRFSHKLYLGFDWLLRISTWPGLILLALLNIEHQFFVYIFTIGYAIVLLILWKLLMRKYRERGFLFLIPIFEIIISILPFILLFKRFLKRKQSRWT